MTKYTLLLFCTVLAHAVSAQTFQWVNRLGGPEAEQYSSISSDSNGNLYVLASHLADVDCGNSFDLPLIGAQDFVLAKMSPNGAFLWAKNFGGLGHDAGASCVVDDAGNIYLTGFFEDTIDFDPGPGEAYLASAGHWDVFACKLDPDGNYIWAKKMGGAKDDQGQLVSIDAAGNVYLAGTFEGVADFNPGDATFNMTAQSVNDVFIEKLDASGNFVWAKRINGGGAGNNVIKGLATDQSGNVYAGGAFKGTIDFDPGSSIHALTYSSGDPNPIFGAPDGYILKLNSSGVYVWAKNIGGSQSSCLIQALGIDPSNNICIMGSHWGYVDFDPGTGVFNMPTANAGLYVAKIDGSGNLLWAKGANGTGWAEGVSLALDKDGNFYVTGEIKNGNVDFDPGPNSTSLTALIEHDFFLVKYNTDGTPAWAQNQEPDQSWRAGIDVDVDDSGNVYTSGYFFGALDFDPGPTEASLSSAGLQDVFIQKIGQTNVAAHEPQTRPALEIFPNPSSGIFTVKTAPDTRFSIKNYLGNTLLEGRTNGELLAIDLSKYASGMYFLVAENQAFQLVKQ